MRSARLAVIAVVAPGPAAAHDAFGDLGPFYANFLHPLADPLQAALVLGAAALLARCPLGFVRVALPLLIGAAALSHVLLGRWFETGPPPFLVAVAAIAAGVAAMLPGRLIPRVAGFGLVAGAGAVAGLLADRSGGAGALQPMLGTVAGLALWATLAWAALDLLARRVSPIAPAVAGSWVAAVGLLVFAFALGPANDGLAGRETATASQETDG